MIRLATEKDFPVILDMCGRFWQHTLYSEPFDRDHTEIMVSLAHEHKLLGVAEVNDQVIGFLAAIKFPLLANRETFGGTEVAWWVEPEFRQGTRGIKLLNFMEKQAKEQGIKYWTMVSMESSEPEKAAKIYQHLNYKRSETSYTKEI